MSCRNEEGVVGSRCILKVKSIGFVNGLGVGREAES